MYKSITQMLRHTLWLILLTLTFSSALASGDQDHECQGGNNCNDGGGGDAQSDSNSDSSSASDSASTASAIASGDVSVSVNSTTPSSVTLRNTPSPDTPNIYPSAPCRIARSAGFSIPGGALSGGTSIEDVECTLRETARVFQYLGVPEVGLFLMCQQSAVINGRYDKKGKLEKGSPQPIGSIECLRLVREFQGDSHDTDDAEDAHNAAVASMQSQLDSIEQRFAERAAGIEQAQAQIRRVAARKSTPQVIETIVQQPMFNEEQRAYFKTLRIENVGETDE